MERTGAAGQLNALLKEEITGMEALAEVLAREYDALRDLRGAALEQVVQRKQECLLDIEAATIRRRAYLEGLGLTPRRAAVATLLDETERTMAAELSTRWARLEELATEIQRRNTLNGALLDANRQRVTQALAILRGTEHEVALYAPDTHGPQAAPSRPLATA